MQTLSEKMKDENKKQLRKETIKNKWIMFLSSIGFALSYVAFAETWHHPISVMFALFGFGFSGIFFKTIDYEARK